jgi:hypothetical protein
MEKTSLLTNSRMLRHVTAVVVLAITLSTGTSVIYGQGSRSGQEQEAQAAVPVNRAMSLPPIPPITSRLAALVRKPDDIDAVTARFNASPRLLNFHLATPMDLSAIGLGKVVYIPVQISTKEGGRKSVYTLNAGEEVLTGIYVNDGGMALDYVKRLSGTGNPAQKGDAYAERITSREGRVIFQGEGSLEQFNSRTGEGTIKIKGSVGSGSPTALVIYTVTTSKFWSCFKKTETIAF